MSEATGMGAQKRIPGATYRLQFNRQFTFAQATSAAEYLRELGVTDAYASPLFKAGAQSTHGYDISCFDEFNPSLGSAGDFERFAGRLREFGLGLLLDMVPNHMSSEPSNRWWVDVLEKGPTSPYASWFDIDWRPLNSDLQNKVLLPTLEDYYAKVLEAGKLQLVFEGERFAVAYYDRRFPLSAPSQIKLQQFCPEPEHTLAAFNGKAGAPRSFDELHALLEQQHYRLAYWRVGPEEINYRRFFDITELVSLRMELPEVFQATHEFLLGLLKAGKLTGLRIDHPDGLWDPKEYFERLQAAVGAPVYVVAEKILTGNEPLPADWPIDGTTGYDFLNRVNGLFVQRAHREDFDKLYREFTGRRWDFQSLVYAGKQHVLESSFLSELNGLAHRLKRVAGRTRYGQDFTLRQLRQVLAELVIALPVYRTYITETSDKPPGTARDYIDQAVHAAEGRRRGPDAAVFEFIRNLLRLQLPADLDETGRRYARDFILRFQQLTGPVMAKGYEDTALYNFNRLISLNEVGGDPAGFGVSLSEFHEHNISRAARWPNTLLATATHDTKRGEDARARIDVLSEMPDAWRQALLRWRALNADKKSLVDHQPAPYPNDEYLLYQSLVGAWPPGAEDNAEELAAFRERLAAYMLKAIREAKAVTSWTLPNSAYEEATRHFVENLLSNAGPNPFLDDFKVFQRKVTFFGQFNSLSQVLLKATAPGVPDFYQGAELWDLNFVDPDNRRPVDYELRRRLLEDLKERLSRESGTPGELPRALLQSSHTGQIKLYLIWRALEFRRSRQDLFAGGAYVPLTAAGTKREHVCAFGRVLAGHAAITVVPRLVLGLTHGAERPPLGLEVWSDTGLCLPDDIPGREFRNVLTNEIFSFPAALGERKFALDGLLGLFPVALLEPIN